MERRISSSALLQGGSLGLVAAYVWLLFIFGIHMPDAGKGLMVIGVPISMATVCVCMVLLRRSAGLARALAGRVGVLTVGVLCAALTAAASFRMLILPYEPIVWALMAVQACVASLWFYVTVGQVVRGQETYLALLIALVIAFVAFGLTLVLTPMAAQAFVALMPLAGCAIVAFAPMGDEADALVVSDSDSSGATGLGAEAGTRVDSSGLTIRGDDGFNRYLTAFFVAVVTATFVKSVGLGLNGPGVGYRLGAVVSLGLVAAFGAILLVLWARGRGRLAPADFYLVAAPGVAFGALVMLVVQVNDGAARALEDVSIIALLAAALFLVSTAVLGHGRPLREVFSSVMGVASAGAFVGWLADNLLVANAPTSNVVSIWLLALIFAVTLSYFFVFPPQAYSAYVADGRFGDAPASGVAFAGDASARDAGATLEAGTEATGLDAMGAAAVIAGVAADDSAHAVSAPMTPGSEAAAKSADGFTPTFAAPSPATLASAEAVTPGDPAERHVTFKEACDILVARAKLTAREAEVLGGMIKGWPDQRIANELFISYNTVRAHVRNIYSKTACHNREELLDAIGDIQHEA